MNIEDFKINGHKIVDWMYEYLRDIEKYPIKPNIVNITYGRGVGYAFDEEVFDDATHSISATKIRKKLREEGKIK